jgi:RNA polymerase sigma factor (sigma-70 family)
VIYGRRNASQGSCQLEVVYEPVVGSRNWESSKRPSLAEFEQLYRSQFGAITAYFARRSRDPQTVADLTSDTFVEAMVSFGSFNPRRGSDRAWLFGIARHVYAKRYASSVRRQTAFRRAGYQRILERDEIDDLVTRIDAERAGRELMESLARLSELDRAAVELVDLAGLTPTEAARALGILPGAMRARLFRARARLHREMEET